MSRIAVPMSKSDVQGTGFREHDPRINYFVKGAPTQNFGDYLPEILAKEFMLHPRIEADIYRLIGSIIDTTWVLRDLRHTIGVQSGHVAFWCCGMRTNAPLDPKVQAMCSFFGVRGPLTRDLLKLSEYENRSVCIPHIHDTKPDAELLKISGSCATTRDFRDRAGATANARQDRECIVRANWRVARCDHSLRLWVAFCLLGQWTCGHSVQVVGFRFVG
jgi:hypothetical protein